MPSWKKVILSGSDAALNSLAVSTNVTASSFTGSFTGSFLGTGSYANQALSSSYALTASFVTGSSVYGPYGANSILSASYAQTASYAQNIVISGSINNVNYIDFNTGSAVPAWKSGRIFWDNTDGALSVYNAEADITLQVGQENWTRVRNNTGVTITNGTVVRLAGSQGDVPTITKAQSVATSGSVQVDNQILGVATHDIEDSSFGYVTTQGLVRGLNTSALTEGATIFVSQSAGLLTSTPPQAPFEIIPVGICVKQSPGGSGIIYVAVDNPIDFSDLSSVKTSGSYNYGDLWTYQPSGSYGVWTHTNQLSGSYAVTGSWRATSFTGSLQGTSSFATSASHAVFSDTASFLPSTTNLNINSISASTAVFTSASIGFLTTVSGSATIIGDAYVVVNSSQATRYAGLAVYESGSNPPVTASWNFDSQTNDWFYGYSSSAGTDYGVALFGPTYNTEGSPTYLTDFKIPKAFDEHHLIDSNLTDSGSRVSSAVPFTVTGSITASAGFLGDLVGTASAATSASFATTASFAQNFNPLATASYALQALSSSYALTASFANTASYVATASYTPNLQQVTTKGNTTQNNIIVSGSNDAPSNVLQISSDGFTVSGSLVGGSLNRKTHQVIYGAVNFSANSTTTIAQLPAPKVAGFTFDYIAYVSGVALQAGRAGVVKGILRNTETGVITKAFQLNETTTLDLTDQGNGTAGLQFTIIQDTNGTSNQLVAIADNTWPYFVNYTLTIYYNPNFS